MTPTIGRIVIYKLTAEQADEINSGRKKPGVKYLDGFKFAVGNTAIAGQEFPMFVTRVNPDNRINGNVMLDGSDSYWAQNVAEGDQDGTWHWPERQV